MPTVTPATLPPARRSQVLAGRSVTPPWLPIGEPPEFDPEASGSPDPDEFATARRLRVLVIEDNPDAAESLMVLLQVIGHDVELAATGPDGVDAARRLHPDAVICDIGLPGLDGYGVARALRADPATSRVRMIAVTGYGTDDDRRRGREAGFDDYLVKPADPARLLEWLGGGS